VDLDSPYRAFSRFTDSGDCSFMLDELPDDVIGICEVARQQTIHHNLLPYYGVPRSQWREMRRVWPPKMPDLLTALKETTPYHLGRERQPAQRIIGACILESYLLAGMLRYKRFPARIRAGYFKDVRANGPHVVRFWEQVGRAKGQADGLPEAEAEKWREENNAYTRRQNEINHHIEHWVSEYWDERARQWQILDANTTFLRAHGDIVTGFHLPRAHFEYAHQAWQQMRSGDDFNPDRYMEEPQDGRSHIRSQMLWDFFSLLQHDLAGSDEPSGEGRKFIKDQTYEETSPQELHELDLLARDPPAAELADFYRGSALLRMDSAEKDPYSAVFRR
jgi:hypothetical protein